jgi:hypothetical protein
MTVKFVRARPQPGDEDNVRAGYTILFEAVLEARKERAQEAIKGPRQHGNPKSPTREKRGSSETWG